MRKQLIIKIPKNDDSPEIINAIANLNTQSFMSGYPIYMFPDWEYEVVELSEPMIIVNDSIVDKWRAK